MYKKIIWLLSSLLVVTALIVVVKLNYSFAARIEDVTEQTGGFYTLVFESNGGTEISSKTIPVFQSAPILPIPEKTGYSFDGWYTDALFENLYPTGIKAISRGTNTVYAKWSKSQGTTNTETYYTLAFNSNGGTNIKSIKVYISPRINPNVNESLDYVPTKVGYAFLGWYTSLEDTAVLYDYNTFRGVNGVPKNGETHTVYAKWEEQTYVLNFDSTGGSAVDSMRIRIGNTFTLPEPTKEGYAFDGWYTDASLTVLFDLSNFKPINSKSYTLYAKWKANYTYYKLKFDKATSGVNLGNVQVCIECGQKPTLPVPTKEGYAFDGWYTDTTLETVYNYKTFSGKSSRVYTLYAKWLKTSSSYTIKFANVNLDPIIVEVGETPKLPTPTKTDFAFGGWYTDAKLLTAYNPKTFVGEKGNVYTLYAKWVRKAKYALRFDSLSGSLVVYIGGEEPVLPVPTKENFRFEGWYTDKGYTKLYDYKTFEAVNDKVYFLYAKWTPTSVYKINLDDGTGTKYDLITVCRGCDVTMAPPLPEPRKEGAIFAGWYIDKEYTTRYDYTTFVAEENATYTLYAKWSEKEQIYTLKLYSRVKEGENGIVGPQPDPDTIDVCMNCGLTSVALPELSYPNYLFWGWRYGATEMDYGTKYDYNTFKAEAGKTYTLTAAWNTRYDFKTAAVMERETASNEKYTLFFNSNEGNALTEIDVCLTCGSNMKIDLPVPVKSGYSFVGWYTDMELTSEYSFNTFKGTNNENYTLYAKWIQNKIVDPSEGTYVLVFDSNDGTKVKNLSVCISCGSVYSPNLPIPQKEGYTFSGWYTDEKLTQKYNYYEVNAKAGEKVNVYAKWVKSETVSDKNDTYIIKFNSNGGTTLKSMNVCLTCGELYVPNLPIPEKEGYTFSGWYTDKKLEKEYNFLSHEAKKDKTYILYAKWTENIVNTFHSNMSLYLKADENTLPSMYSLQSSPATLETAISDKLNSKIKEAVSYDINIMLDSSLKIQPNGKVKLYFPDQKGLKVGIYRIDEENNNELVNYDVHYEEEIPYIYTDHFSIYVVGELGLLGLLNEYKYIILAAGALLIIIITLIVSNKKKA